MSSYITNIMKSIDWVNMFNNKPSTNTSQVLDPISCLIRLVLLIYKPPGTKLSFSNNKIIFQEPDLLQSTKRWTSGDNRSHIHNLYNPIFKISLWYDVSKTELIYLLEKSKRGLQILLECYNSDESNVVSHSITYYLKTIDNILNNDLSNDLNEKLSDTTDIYSIKLKNLWSENEINIIYLLLLEIDEKNNADKFNNTQSLISALEDILKGKDDILQNIVNKLSTSL